MYPCTPVPSGTQGQGDAQGEVLLAVEDVVDDSSIFETPGEDAGALPEDLDVTILEVGDEEDEAALEEVSVTTEEAS